MSGIFSLYMQYLVHVTVHEELTVATELPQTAVSYNQEMATGSLHT